MSSNTLQMLVVVSQQVQSRACWNKGPQNTQDVTTGSQN